MIETDYEEDPEVVFPPKRTRPLITYTNQVSTDTITQASIEGNDSRGCYEEPKPHTVIIRCYHWHKVNYVSPETLEVKG